MAQKDTGTGTSSGAAKGRAGGKDRAAAPAAAKKAGTRAAPKKGDGVAKTGATPKKGSEGASKAAAARVRKGPDLRKDLRDFASARPQGWHHEDWLTFLDHLQSRGHDIRDREQIGRALERERLDLALSRVEGIGPQRRKALVERYGTIWSLRNADPDEVAREFGVKRPVAERIREQLH